MTILDQRLTQTEDRLSTVLAHSRNLVNVPPQTASSHYPVSSNNPYFRNPEGSSHDDVLRGDGNVDYSYRDEGEEEEGGEGEGEEEEGEDSSGDDEDNLYGEEEKRYIDQDYSEDDNEDDYSYGD